MSHLTSLVGLLAVLILLTSNSSLDLIAESPSPALPVDVPVELTLEQQRFVAWGEARFAAAGLVLPRVRYVFHAGTEACRWHRGLYHPSTGVVEICNMNRETLIHELAHAWAEANITDHAKDVFMESRGLEVWNDHAVDWSERGTEHVAEVIAWGVEEHSRLVSWVEPDGRHTFRLLSIPDSTPDELLAAYKALTGREAHLRDPGEWDQVERSEVSPEANRPATSVPVQQSVSLLDRIRSGEGYDQPAPGFGSVTVEQVLKENPELKSAAVSLPSAG